MNRLLNSYFAFIPFILLDVNGCDMMDWWGVPFLGYWFIGILIGVVIIVAYFIIHTEKKEEKEIMSDAQKTLEERYTEGEMTREEYLQAKKDLKNFNPK